MCFFNSRLDVARPDKTSGADINAICQEASYHICHRRVLVFPELHGICDHSLCYSLLGWHAGC